MPLEYRDAADPSRTFYDVEKAVGLNSPNQREDVRMVQYMLQNIYGAPAVPPGFVDGWIGPVTIAWIKKFQTDMNTGGKRCVVDGRVDGVTNFATFKGRVSDLVYTIAFLNEVLKRVNPAAHAKIPSVVPVRFVPPGSPRPNPYNPVPVQVPSSGGI